MVLILFLVCCRKRKVSNAMLPHDGDSCTMPNSHPKDSSVEQGCSHPKDKVLVDVSGEDHHPQPPPSNPEIVKPHSNLETPVKTPSDPGTPVKTPSDPETLVRTPSDPETLVRNSSSNSKSSGYQSNGDVTPPPENVRESPTTPSQPHTGVQEDKVAQDKNDSDNHPKVAAPKDNKVKPAVKGAVRERSQSDGHDRKPPLVSIYIHMHMCALMMVDYRKFTAYTCIFVCIYTHAYVRTYPMEPLYYRCFWILILVFLQRFTQFISHLLYSTTLRHRMVSLL